jgi:hypothetical protein
VSGDTLLCAPVTPGVRLRTRAVVVQATPT